MRCSIIIPTLNEASVIEGTLRRLQRLGPFEVIVADGGSDDGTVELAAPHTTIVRSRAGRGTQLNAGAARATGDTLLFLHADVRLPPDALAAIEDALRDPEVIGGFFRVRFGRTLQAVFIAVIYDLVRFGGRGLVYGDSAIFVRRDLFERLGGFADWQIMEDADLVSRMRRVGKLAALPQTVVPSSRRWRRGGFWRTWASWWTVQMLYFLPVSPRWLGRFYQHVR